MQQTAARHLFSMMEDYNAAFTKASAQDALHARETDFALVAQNMYSLQRATIDEILAANFKASGKQDALRDRVSSVVAAILNNAAARVGASTRGPIVSDTQLEQVRSVVEQLEEQDLPDIALPSRDVMISETERLIAEVKGWEIEEYAKRVLLMKLNAIQRLAQTADLYSAAELWMRVKGVIADFVSEFEAHDKKYDGLRARMLTWARKAFFPVSAALGLTADASSVAGLLPPP